jgi:hypothetical protein
MLNNKGNIFSLPVVLMGLFMTITFLVALLPAMTEILNGAQASNSLNCAGYNDTITWNAKLNYNASVPTSTIGCMALRLYIPYIVLGVLIASVAGLFGQKINYGLGETSPQGGGQYY